MSATIKFVMNLLEERLGKRVAKQIVYILLLVFGVERKVILSVFGASPQTLHKYKLAIETENIESIFEQNYNRPKSELEKYKAEIFKELETNPVSNVREAAARIEKITGIKRGLTQVGKFLKKGASKAGR